MQSICRGLALELAVGHTTMRGMPDGIVAIGGSETFGAPNAFFVVLAVAIAGLVMTKAMVWGRWIYAGGGNPQAALEMGIPVRGVLVSTYVISGVCVGIGAIVLAGRTGASSPLYGNLLDVGHGGALVLVSVVNETVAFSDPELHKRETTVVCSRNALRTDFERVMAAIEAGRVPLGRLLTHRTTLASAALDIPRWAREKTGLVKALVEIE